MELLRASAVQAGECVPKRNFQASETCRYFSTNGTSVSCLKPAGHMRWWVKVGVAFLAMALPQMAAFAQSGDAAQQTMSFDPTRPMDDMPDINVAWPEITDNLTFTDESFAALLDESQRPDFNESQLALFEQLFGNDGSGASNAPNDVPIDPQDKLLYGYSINGTADLPVEDIESRFDSFSALNEHDGEGANIAQIRLRANDDRALLENLLQIDGFYDALVQYEVNSTDAKKLSIVYNVQPGVRYRISSIVLGPVQDAMPEDRPVLTEAFGVAAGDAADQDNIDAGRTRLAVKAGEIGYPFASVGQPELTVDHAALAAALLVPGTSGGRYDMGRIIVPEDDILGAKHIMRIARFDMGDRFDVRDLQDLRQALVATGLVSQVEIKPVRDAAQPGVVDLEVNITPAPMRTIAGEAGYSTGQGVRAEVSWEHRNFFPPEGALQVRAVVGTREQLGGVTYRRNNWLGRDRVLTIGALASNSKYSAYDAKTAKLSASLERKTTLIFQKRWAWNVGAEVLYTDERGVIDNLTVSRRTYYIAALPLGIFYDGTDNLLDPRQGFRLGMRLSPEYSLQGGSSIYVRGQIDGSVYVPVTDDLVFAGRARLGSIFGGGSGIEQIAPSRRSYAGGGGSVRGYGYRTIGPQYSSGDPLGGRGLLELSAEARYRIGNFGIVPFIDAGTVSSEVYPDFNQIRVGAGIGGRYYSSFGPIRLDVATPLNRLPGESWIAVYVSLGQAF